MEYFLKDRTKFQIFSKRKIKISAPLLTFLFLRVWKDPFCRKVKHALMCIKNASMLSSCQLPWASHSIQECPGNNWDMERLTTLDERFSLAQYSILALRSSGGYIYQSFVFSRQFSWLSEWKSNGICWTKILGTTLIKGGGKILLGQGWGNGNCLQWEDSFLIVSVWPGNVLRHWLGLIMA